MKTFLALLALSAVCMADNVVVRVTDEKGAPVTTAQVAAILKSGAYQDCKLDKESSDYKCQPAEECQKIFVGAPGFEAASAKYDGRAGTCTVRMKANPDKSSAIRKGKGPLPGLEGTVTPILDEFKRTYMYSNKIGLTVKGKTVAQPVDFVLNKPIEAVTPTGQKFQIWVKEITPQIALLEYSAPK